MTTVDKSLVILVLRVAIYKSIKQKNIHVLPILSVLNVFSLIFNNYSPKAKWILVNIITQVIIEIPKQRNVTIFPQFAIVDKSSYHAAPINVSRNAFLNSRFEEKSIFFDVHTG